MPRAEHEEPRPHSPLPILPPSGHTVRRDSSVGPGPGSGDGGTQGTRWKAELPLRVEKAQTVHDLEPGISASGSPHPSPSPAEMGTRRDILLPRTQDLECPPLLASPCLSCFRPRPRPPHPTPACLALPT